MISSRFSFIHWHRNQRHFYACSNKQTFEKWIPNDVKFASFFSLRITFMIQPTLNSNKGFSSILENCLLFACRCPRYRWWEEWEAIRNNRNDDNFFHLMSFLHFRSLFFHSSLGRRECEKNGDKQKDLLNRHNDNLGTKILINCVHITQTTFE